MFGRLRRPLHVSWLVAWFAAAIIGGIAVSFWASQPIEVGPLIFATNSLLFIAFAKKTSAMVFLVITAGLLVGMARGGAVRSQTSVYQPFFDRQVKLSGTVADDVTHKNGMLGVKLKDVTLNGKSAGGQVWANVNSNLDLARGYRLALDGQLSPGFGAFAASLSRATLDKAKSPTHYDFTRAARDNFAAGLRRAVPEPNASLGLGYLTGQHNDLPSTLTKQLQLVGLIHLVIAGGYNVTILVRFARRRFAKISKYLGLLTASLILLIVTLMAGFTAPMARTVIVTGLSLWAWFYGRRLHPLVLLSVAAAITGLFDPAFVWGDVGWYMTFVAYGGLIILAPMLKQTFWGADAPPSTLRQILIDTISVQIVTMPIMAFVFNQYSIYGLPANLLVLPLMSLTMLLTLIAGLGGMILPISIVHLIGWPANILLGYTAEVTSWLASANGADAVASYTIPTMALTYTAIIFVLWLLWRKTQLNFRAVNVVE